MITEIKFMALSKSKSQILELKNYIQELYIRNYGINNRDRQMRGYDLKVFTSGKYHILIGTHIDCTGFMLSYWCKQEGKNKLLKDVVYLEEDFNCIRHYIYEPHARSYWGVWAQADGFYKCDNLTDSDYAKALGLSEKQGQLIQAYFKSIINDLFWVMVWASTHKRKDLNKNGI